MLKVLKKTNIYMNDIIIYKLSKLGIDTSKANKTDSKGFSRASCPFCSADKAKDKNKSLAFKPDTGFYFCHKCNSKGNVTTEKKEYKRPIFVEHKESNKVIDYLVSRGISERTIKKLVSNKLISYSKYDDKFIFLYHRGDDLINYKTRSVSVGTKDFSQQTDGEKILFNINSVKGKDEVIVVEGEMGAIACIEAGLDEKYGIVSLENGAQTEGEVIGKFAGLFNCYKELSHVKKFIIATDNDKAGTYTGSALIRYLGEGKSKIIEYPIECKDPDDIINRNTRGRFTSFENNKVLFDMIESAIDFPVKSIVTLTGPLKELLMSYKQHGRPKARPLPVKTLNDYFSFLSGQLTCITGYANMGKSTFAEYLCAITAISFNWKWAIFAAEQYPVDKYFENIACMLLKKNIQRFDRLGRENVNVATDEEVAEVYHFLEDKIYLIYPDETEICDTKWLYKKLNYLKETYGINGFILDTFNKLDHDFGHDRDDVYMGKWLNVSIKEARHFDAFIVVMHPPKPTKTKSGSYAAPDIYDIAHGAQAANKLDNIVVVHRESRFSDTPAPPNTAEIYIRKLRDADATGKIGRIDCEWDRDSHTYRFGSGLDEFEMSLNDYYVRLAKDAFEDILIPTDDDIPF